MDGGLLLRGAELVDGEDFVVALGNRLVIGVNRLADQR
jgi:hypothetical protein